MKCSSCLERKLAHKQHHVLKTGAVQSFEMFKFLERTVMQSMNPRIRERVDQHEGGQGALKTPWTEKA